MDESTETYNPFNPNLVSEVNLFESQSDRMVDSYARYSAVINTGLKKALAWDAARNSESTKTFMDQFNKMAYLNREAIEERSKYAATAARYARAESNVERVLAGGEGDVEAITRDVTSIATKDVSPIETASDIHMGKESKPMSAYTSYLRDQALALETAGWDFKAGANTAENIAINLFGGVGRTADTAREFVPFKYSIDWARFDFGPFDMRDYQKLSISQQEEMRKRVMKVLEEKHATPFEAMHIMDMLDPTSSIAFESGIGLIDAIGSLSTVKWGLTKLKTRAALKRVERIIELQKMRQAAGFAAKLGDKETAGAIVARVLTGGKTAETAANMTKEEAMLAAIPFDYTPIAPEQLEGLSAKAIKAIERERKLQYWELVRSFNNMQAPTSGYLREGEELAAIAKIEASLPEGASITKRTPWGVTVRVVHENTGAFASEEDMLRVKTQLEQSIDTYNTAVKRLDDFYEEARGGKWEPDPTVVNRMEFQKDRAKTEMMALEKRWAEGMKKTKPPEERFVWYEYANDVGKMLGDVGVTPPFPMEATGINKVLSPDIWMQRIDSLMTNERTSILAKQEQLGKLFGRAMRQTLAHIGKTEREAVGAIILHGTDTHTVYTAKQLNAGVDVPGIGTVRLNPKQIASYYKYREVADQAHRMMSLKIFRELGGKGYSKQATVMVAGNPTKIFLKDASLADLGRANVKRIWDNSIRDPLKIRQIDESSLAAIQKKLDSGKYKLVNLEDSIYIRPVPGSTDIGDYLNYALIQVDKMNDLTPDVLPYEVGYSPRWYKDAPYIVRVKTPAYIDGNKELTYDTVRFFSRRDEAKRWADDQIALTGKTYEVEDEATWRVKDPTINFDLDGAAFTGMFKGHRNPEGPIPYGEAALPTPRHDPFSSMERYLQNLAWSYPLNEYRASMVQRFLNSYGKFLTNPHDWMNPELSFVANTDNVQKSVITNIRNNLLDSISITTQGERDWNRTLKGITETLERVTDPDNKLMNSIRVKTLYVIDKVDLFAALRRLNFYTHLGWGNPSQIVVQAANIPQILAANPQNIHRVLPRIFAVRMAAFMSPADPAWDATMTVLSKAAMMKEGHFKDMMMAAHRSGYFFTVVSNADASVALRGLAPGGDLRNIGRFVNTVLQLPFLEPELWSRVTGWIDAYTRISAKTKKYNWAESARDIDKITHEALRTAYNYQMTNRAYFQKAGPLSVITQFVQPMTKFYENVMLPMIPGSKIQGRFTRAERFRVAIAQPLLFGAAGLPFYHFMQEVGTRMWEWATGKDRAEFSDQERIALSGGITDLTAGPVFDWLLDTDGSHPQIARRISLANIEQFVTKFSPETTMYEFMLGPAGVFPKRIARAVEAIATLHMSSFKAGTLTEDDMFGVMDELGTIVATSWNNYHKARLWGKAGQIISNQYGGIYKINPDDPRGIVALRSLGFSTWEEQAAYEMQDYLTEHSVDTQVRDIIAALENLTVHFMDEGFLTNDPKQLEKYMLQKEIIIGSVQTKDGQPEYEVQAQIRKLWSERILDKDSKVRQMAEKRIDDMLITEEMEPTPVTWGLIEPDVFTKK